ncbi:unnamed protein product [Mycena citricolor]|uniref:Peptidase metallopeptidase domain-containing protein n=1 Tax=Mycena citricolor TaxID=2018698 RepID=A0AAD2JYI5_9AGAR|nr:unnamed protein product [Mycena citricolor]
MFRANPQTNISSSYIPDSTPKVCAMAVTEAQKAPSVTVSNEAIVGAVGGVPSVTGAEAVVGKLDQLWDSGATITYSYLNGTPAQQAKVDGAILEWFPYANITFQRALAGILRISFNTQQGSWSYVGLEALEVPKNQPTLNLGWVSDSAQTTQEERGLILHEFGHVLGLMHEHQSPAHGGAVTLDANAVHAHFASSLGWSADMTKTQVVDHYSTTSVSNFPAVDPSSIMAYFLPPALNEQRVQIPANVSLSESDKAYMVLAYPRPKPHALAPNWTLERALQVFGADPETAQGILSARGDVLKIRALFLSFLVQKRTGLETRISTDGFESDEEERSGTMEFVRKEVEVEEPVEIVAPSPFVPPIHDFYLQNGPANVVPLVPLSGSPPGRSLTAAFYAKQEVAEPIQTVVPPPEPVVVAPQPAVVIPIPVVPAEELIAATEIPTSIPETAPAPAVVFVPEQEATAVLTAEPQHEVALAPVQVEEPVLLMEVEPVVQTPLTVPAQTRPRGMSLVATTRNRKRSIVVTEIPRPVLAAIEAAAPEIEPVVSVSEPAIVPAAEIATAEPVVRTKRIFVKNKKVGRTEPVTVPVVAEVLPEPVVVETPCTEYLPTLTNALEAVFPAEKSQTWRLQTKGKVIDPADFVWDTSLAAAGIDAQWMKPDEVAEAEASIVDLLFGGKTEDEEKTLSSVFEQMLYSLVPKPVHSPLSEQQDKIRQWLQTEVPVSRWQLATEKTSADAERSETKMSRLELSEYLMDQYSAAKQAWESEKALLIKKLASTDRTDIKERARSIAQLSVAREKEIATKYRDAVVGGDIHRVKEYIAFLDIPINPAAHALQDAKEILRESSSVSLPTGEKVYPVQLAPVDWFASLPTSFTQQDLSNPTESVGGADVRPVTPVSSAPIQSLLPAVKLDAPKGRWEDIVLENVRSDTLWSVPPTTIKEDRIDVAFRASKVDIDRSAWFKPQIFKDDQSPFYKMDQSTALPSQAGYAASFIVAKDIVVRVKHTDIAHDLINAINSSSLLSFAYSKYTDSFQPHGDGFLVKIPGPQVIGYIVEPLHTTAGTALVPADFTVDVPAPDLIPRVEHFHHRHAHDTYHAVFPGVRLVKVDEKSECATCHPSPRNHDSNSSSNYAALPDATKSTAKSERADPEEQRMPEEQGRDVRASFGLDDSDRFF